MTAGRGLVLDANILIRAVLGRRVRSLLETYEESMAFYTPDICFRDAREYIPDILASRGADPQAGLILLQQIGLLVQPVDHALYLDFEQLAARDIDDWPIVATALMLQTPVWTEDQDFFGSGLATWTTDRVELYLGGSHA
jgi:predicted nucleic acid-binding protein